MSYIDKDYFFNKSGLDLDVEFETLYFDSAEAPQMFINRVEENAIAFLKDRYDNTDFETKVNNNLEEFKKGMFYQVYDKLKNGETSEINPTALVIWSNIGLCNLRRGRSNHLNWYE